VRGAYQDQHQAVVGAAWVRLWAAGERRGRAGAREGPLSSSPLLRTTEV
jgi:hypothetical protein